MAVEGAGEFWGVFGNLVAVARRPLAGCNRKPGMRRSGRDTTMKSMVKRRMSAETKRLGHEISLVLAIVVVVFLVEVCMVVDVSF